MQSNEIMTFLWVLLLGVMGDFLMGQVKDKVPFFVVRRVVFPWWRYLHELRYLRDLIVSGQKLGWNNTRQEDVLNALKVDSTNGGETLNLAKLLSVTIETHSKIIILGDSGSGKTFALNAFVYRTAEKAFKLNVRFWTLFLGVMVILAVTPWMIMPATALPMMAIPALGLISTPFWERFVRTWPIPARVNCRTYREKETFDQFLKHELHSTRNGKVAFEDHGQLAESKRLALFLDGLNEVDYSLYSDAHKVFRNELTAPLSTFRDIPIIITSRIEPGSESFPPLEAFEMGVVTVLELDDDGIKAYLASKFMGKTDENTMTSEVNKWFQKLQDSNLLNKGGLARNLFWLKHIFDTNNFSGNVGDVLREVTETHISAELKNPKKAYHHSIVPLDDEMEALGIVAAHMTELGTHKVMLKVVEDVILSTWVTRNSPLTAQNVLQHAEGAALIEPIRGRTPEVAFRHEWLKHFFAGWSLNQIENEEGLLLKTNDFTKWGKALHLYAGFTPKYQDLIEKLIEDSKQPNRVLLALSLLYCGQPKEVIKPFRVKTLQAAYHSLRVLGRASKPEIVDLITNDLVVLNVRGQISGYCKTYLRRGRSMSARRGAAYVLGTFRDESSIADLIDAFAEIRLVEAAIDAVTSIGEPAIPNLKIVCKSRVELLPVRRAAAICISRILGESAFVWLFSTLRDENLSYRNIVIEAMVEIGDGIIPPIASRLESGTVSEDERLDLVTVLGDLQSQIGLATVLSHLEWDVQHIRWRATQSLSKILVKNPTIVIEEHLSSNSTLARYGIALAKGRSFYLAGRWAESLEDYREAESLISDDSLLYHWLGETYGNLGDYQNLLHVSRLGRGYSNLPFFNGEIGKTYYWLGNDDEAIAELSLSIQDGTPRANHFYFRALCYQKQKQHVQALADLNQAIRLLPTNAVYYSRRGLSHQDLNEDEAAFEDYRRALYLDKGLSEVFWFRAQLYKRRQEYDAAIKDFEKAMEYGQPASKVYGFIGDTYRESGNFRLARDNYLSSIRSGTPEPVVHYWLGVVHDELGEKDEAIACLERYYSNENADEHTKTLAVSRLNHLRGNADSTEGQPTTNEH